MTTQTDKQWLTQAYKDTFGRDPSYGTLGGGDYWLDQMTNNPDTHTKDEVLRMLQGSAEGQSVTTAADGTKSSWLGGVNPNQSIAQNIANDANAANPWDKSWASNFTKGGTFGPDSDLTGTIWEGMAGAGDGTTGTTQNVAGLLNATYNANNPNSTLPNPYFNNAPIVGDGTGNTNIPIVGGDATTPGEPDNTGNWYDQFDSIDAFKDALGLGDSSSSGGGMNDFMQFMMFMNMMRPQGGMGGGSQYGYGGLNPGGVMSAYNPMDNFQGMMDAFNTLKGGTTTNTGTA